MTDDDIPRSSAPDPRPLAPSLRLLASKVLVCVDCVEEFIFSSGEARYFISKGLAEPKRCPSCRRLRKRGVPQRVGG